MKLVTDKIFPAGGSKSGKYIVLLHLNGCLRAIIIDDLLPQSRDRKPLHVVSQTTPNLIYPALIEKAFLKVMGGYDFPGSNSSTDLHILTGWIPEVIHLQEFNPVPRFTYPVLMVQRRSQSRSSMEESFPSMERRRCSCNCRNRVPLHARRIRIRPCRRS